jgi:Mn2+/Fe2+ NRAMP family transporter
MKRPREKIATRLGHGRAVRTPSAASFSSVVSKVLRGLRALGPGIVTGAADDDPSGIATYFQVGAQFGFAMLWTMLFSYPLMAGIQEIRRSARGCRDSVCSARALAIGAGGSLYSIHFTINGLYDLVDCSVWTTISPYLFFWQASQEVQEQEAAAGEKALKRAPDQASVQLQSMRTDTYIGMAFSNVIAFFIILDTAAVPHTHGVTDIQTAAQAAEALRPLAGELTFLLFSFGIIGTGLLAVPVLAGSAAYALAEALKWQIGLERKLLRIA